MIQKKICLLGAFSVGKTSLINRYVKSMFDDKYLTTVGVKINKKVLTVNTNELSLIIWDIAGEDDFYSIRSSYLQGMAGYIIVIDGMRLNSYHVALSVHERVQSLSGKLPMIFALNKNDLRSQWHLDNQHIQYLHQFGYPVMETSAKDNAGVEEMFMSLAAQLVS